MHRKALFLAGLALASSPIHAASTLRTLDSEVALSGATTIKVKVSVGDLTVVGDGGDTIRAHAEVRCSSGTENDCKEAADRIVLGSRRSGDQLVIEVEGFPKLKNKGLTVNVRVELPRAMPLSVHSGVGDIEVFGTLGNLEVDAGVGDVHVTSQSSHLKRIELDTGVGDVKLHIGDQTIEGSGFVGKGLDWSQGKGAATLEIDTGVGDIRVTLE